MHTNLFQANTVTELSIALLFIPVTCFHVNVSYNTNFGA